MTKAPETPVSRVEVITSVQRRRRWTTAEKVRLVEEASQPEMSVSFVARRAGIAPSQPFAWKRRMAEGGQAAVAADEDVVGDNGSAYIAADTADTARALGVPLLFTPVRSPESNGMSESFVKPHRP